MQWGAEEEEEGEEDSTEAREAGDEDSEEDHRSGEGPEEEETHSAPEVGVTGLLWISMPRKDWLDGSRGFNVVSAIFWPYNGGDYI